MPEVAKASAFAGVILAGAFDVKAAEIAFVQAELERRGVNVILVECGVLGSAEIEAHVSRAEVAAAGGGDIEILRRERNRETAIPIMLRGLEAVVRRLV